MTTRETTPRPPAAHSRAARYASAHPAAVLALVTAACLLPFVGKAFHIDDPLFLWVARQIQEHPLDFYGFPVNWYGDEMPMWAVTKNPPLSSYYTAAVALAFGWGEVPLHLAFVVPAVGAAVGSYYLAEAFCSRPLVAALAGTLTPVFLLCGTSVMSDVGMVCFWVWAVVFWVRGVDGDEPSSLLVAALLVAACALTKYFGMALIPLLAVYAVAATRGVGRWALFLLIPVLILAGYQWATDALYGRGLLFDAAAYATTERLRGGANFAYKTLTALAFTGGCLATALFYAPLLWPRRYLALGLLLAGVLALGPPLLAAGDEARWGFHLQFGILILAGLHVLALVVADLVAHRDREALFLFLWVTGTFLFAGFVNWTVSGRTFLPMAPAVGILLVRRHDWFAAGDPSARGTMPRWPLVPAAALALTVAWADYTLAGTARRGAEVIRDNHAGAAGRLWFQGHWGFQYYMQSLGGEPLEMRRSRLEAGDLMAVPGHNTNLQHPGEDLARLAATYRFGPCPWLSTSHPVVEAGFYSDTAGALPFAFGAVPAEEYYVYVVTRSVQLR